MVFVGASKSGIHVTTPLRNETLGYYEFSGGIEANPGPDSTACHLQIRDHMAMFFFSGRDMATTLDVRTQNGARYGCQCG